MPADVLQVLIVISLLVAFVVAVRAWLLWRTVESTRADVRALTVRLQGGPGRAPASASSFRGKLTEANAAVERALWSLARFDERSLRLEGQLRTRRAAIDELRERHLAAARRGIAGIRRTVRLLRQMMELRRTFLG